MTNMEKDKEAPERASEETASEPPPFQPDPDLIAFAEHWAEPAEKGDENERGT